MLTQAQRRANFSTAVPAKTSKLLAAQVAYGREQWQKAIDLYKKYDTEHGADSEALTHIARAYRSLGNTEQMTHWQETHIKRFPDSNQSQEILWLRAWNLEQAGNFKSAAASYKRILSAKGKRTEEAYVRHALCYYKMGKFDSVIVHLAEFRKAYPSSSYFWSGLFWQGKAHIEAGRTADAHKIWKEIIQLDPADYHAHRAKQLMGMVDSSAAGILMPEHLARAWLDSIPPISQRKKLSKADSTLLGRGAALLSVARTDVAAFFLDDYEKNYPGNLLLQYDLACAYEIAGSIAQGFRAAWRLGWRIPTGYRGHIPLQMQAKIYPPHYLPIIRKYAERFKVDPLFIISVMRQESIFDSSIISHAGAIGLMQVIPPTGKLIAGELNEKNFANDSLHKPDFAVRYGTYYLRKRMNQFNNNMVLTLGAYNGGAHNVVKWIERNPDTKSDIFVEDIGFLETRLYVKKVMGYYWTYQRLMSTPGYDVYFK
jgi:soluble lytic murein transglycosylase